VSRRPRGHRRTTESFTGRSANRGARHEGVGGSRPGAMGRVTVLRFPVSRLRTHFGGWSDLRAKPHASAPQHDGGRREDSDHERDQLPPRIISAVLRGNRYQTNRGGDAGTGCCHPLVTAVHNPAREHAQREDRQRSDRVRPLDTEGREDKEDGDEYGHRGDPSHPSIVGRATPSVNRTERPDAPIGRVTKVLSSNTARSSSTVAGG